MIILLIALLGVAVNNYLYKCLGRFEMKFVFLLNLLFNLVAICFCGSVRRNFSDPSKWFLFLTIKRVIIISNWILIYIRSSRSMCPHKFGLNFVTRFNQASESLWTNLLFSRWNCYVCWVITWKWFWILFNC